MDGVGATTVHSRLSQCEPFRIPRVLPPPGREGQWYLWKWGGGMPSSLQVPQGSRCVPAHVALCSRTLDPRLLCVQPAPSHVCAHTVLTCKWLAMCLAAPHLHAY